MMMIKVFKLLKCVKIKTRVSRKKICSGGSYVVERGREGGREVREGSNI